MNKHAELFKTEGIVSLTSFSKVVFCFLQRLIVSAFMEDINVVQEAVILSFKNYCSSFMANLHHYKQNELTSRSLRSCPLALSL